MKGHIILAVDDDADTLEVLCDTIDSLDATPLRAADQEEALRILTAKTPCMVLLDLQIKADRRSPARTETGFNLLRRIRGQFSHEQLRVILVSGHAIGKDDVVNRAYRDGIDDYVRKPFDDGDLERQIRHWLSQCLAHGNSDARRPHQSPTADLIFDGKPNEGDRHLLRLFGKDVWVRPKTIEVLCKLSVERQKGGGGWIKTQSIDKNPDCIYMTMKRVREDLMKVPGASKLIQKKRGQIRISIPPERISCDDTVMREHFDHLELPRSYRQNPTRPNNA